MSRNFLYLAAIIAFYTLKIAPVHAQGRQMPVALPTEPVVLETYDARIKATVVAQGIPRPFGFAVLPDGEILITELRQRVRDISQGPDGFIYLLTEEENGAVIRLEPVQ